MHIATYAITDLRSLKAVIKALRGKLPKDSTGVEELHLPFDVWVRLRDERNKFVEPDYFGFVDGVKVMPVWEQITK